jgi:hypothetical protein
VRHQLPTTQDAAKPAALQPFERDGHNSLKRSPHVSPSIFRVRDDPSYSSEADLFPPLESPVNQPVRPQPPTAATPHNGVAIGFEAIPYFTGIIRCS